MDTDQQQTGFNTEQDTEEPRVSIEDSRKIKVEKLQEYEDNIAKHSTQSISSLMTTSFQVKSIKSSGYFPGYEVQQMHR